ncbi:hypothetical protein BLA60_21025 [Actinophytocola xinjiangensis]|uniref:Gram-positive cocci surface proteins LPxTG domain-containing protein n=1 Tax=Actinophytocola xinjiangensis TaxID=485602 RepID=A0A7Z0WJY0_9PSEU|nr:hypothetical protein [Actinophytocola xinjiangensis]OLF09070.1 hypothetical protein BLA60_21025 [Actinophytocola xinjiangensis]
MKLGRALAAGAVLWAVALPLTTGTALADETPSAPVATTPAEDPTAAPKPPAPGDAEPPEAVPAEDEKARDEKLEGASPQVRERPDGAPETGGGPVDSGTDLAVAGGAAGAAVVAAGGIVLALRRRRAGSH